eukprot:64969_1
MECNQPFDIDIDWFIIKIFQQKQFNDTKTFILRVLYCLQELTRRLECNIVGRKKDLETAGLWKCGFDTYNMNNIRIMYWSLKIYGIYFKPESIPSLYSRIVGQTHVDFDDTKTIYELTPNIGASALTFSKMYLEQQRTNRLSHLSKIYDQWISANMLFNTAEQQHLKHLICLHRYHGTKLTKSTLVDEEYIYIYHHLVRYYEYVIESLQFFLMTQNVFIGNKYNGTIFKLGLILLQSITLRVKTEMNDITFLKKIGKLCYKHYKINKRCLCASADDKLIAHNMAGSCLLLGVYYFWFRYNTQKGLKFMRKAFKYKSKIDKKENIIIFSTLSKMEYAIGNFDECMRLDQLELNLYKNSNDLDSVKKKQHEIKMMDCKNIRNRNHNTNKSMTTWRIKLMKQLDTEQRHKLEREEHNKFITQIKMYFSDSRCYNIMKNAIELKQCNYRKCNRKDLESFMVCKRCKSAYYCCRKHREYCVEHEKRVYSDGRKMKTDPVQYDIALRLFMFQNNLWGHVLHWCIQT